MVASADRKKDAPSRIAVLIPAFNEVDGLLKTIRSIDTQAANFEFFIVDDGSQPAIDIDLQNLVHPANLIRLPENQGCARARNTGLQQIIERGFDYVALQDAGDVDIGERLKKQAFHLDQNTDVAVVGGWGEHVDLSGRHLYIHKPPTGSREIRARMPFSSAFTHPACMIRVSALNAVGLYDPSYPNSSDYELLLRLTQQFESANLPEVLIKKENNPASLSLGKRSRSLRYRLRAQLKHFRAWSLRSYLGVMTTLAFMVIPYRLILAFKEKRGHAG